MLHLTHETDFATGRESLQLCCKECHRYASTSIDPASMQSPLMVNAAIRELILNLRDAGCTYVQEATHDLVPAT